MKTNKYSLKQIRNKNINVLFGGRVIYGYTLNKRTLKDSLKSNFETGSWGLLDLNECTLKDFVHLDEVTIIYKHHVSPFTHLETIQFRNANGELYDIAHQYKLSVSRRLSYYLSYEGGEYILTHPAHKYCYFRGDITRLEYAKESGYQIYINRGDYVAYRNAYSAYTDRRSIFIDSYHSSRSVSMGATGRRFKVGIEIEKEDEILISRDLETFKKEFPKWRLESDSSLHTDEFGYELISPTMGFDTHNDIQKIKYELERLKDYINGDISERCGTHITVSDSNFLPSDLYDSLESYLPLLYALYPSRRENSYSRAKHKGDYKEERGALNLKSRAVEIRIFPATINLNQLYFRLSLVRFMLSHYIERSIELKDIFENESFSDLFIELYGDEFFVKYDKLKERTNRFAKQYGFIENYEDIFNDEILETN